MYFNCKSSKGHKIGPRDPIWSWRCSSLDPNPPSKLNFMTFWTFTIKIHLIDDFIKKLKNSRKDLMRVHETLGLWLEWYNTYIIGINNLLRHNHQFHHPDFGRFWVKNSKIMSLEKVTHNRRGKQHSRMMTLMRKS